MMPLAERVGEVGRKIHNTAAAAGGENRPDVPARHAT